MKSKARVNIITYTSSAEELLIFSKKTRLNMTPSGYDKVHNLTCDTKLEELDYIMGTIGSSLEFVDYVFAIEDVTRAFTHQLVRHRVGTSFAQQTQRAVDMREGFDYLATGECDKMPAKAPYTAMMQAIEEGYRDCIAAGAPPQDARGGLPTNILTNILFKVNLRSLAGIMATRLCFKTQGEFQEVAKLMRDAVLELHPWTKSLLKVACCQTGVCAFPGYGYTECPMREVLPKIDLKRMEQVWEGLQHEAVPCGEQKKVEGE